MTLTEFYDKAGGNYEEVLCRLMNDALVKKFLIKFLDDKSCKNIFGTMDDGESDQWTFLFRTVFLFKHMDKWKSKSLHSIWISWVCGAGSLFGRKEIYQKPEICAI